MVGLAPVTMVGNISMAMARLVRLPSNIPFTYFINFGLMSVQRQHASKLCIVNSHIHPSILA